MVWFATDTCLAGHHKEATKPHGCTKRGLGFKVAGHQQGVPTSRIFVLGLLDHAFPEKEECVLYARLPGRDLDM